MIVPAASLAKTLNGFQRPFRTSLYPWLPIFALSAVGAVLAATAWLNIWQAITFIGLPTFRCFSHDLYRREWRWDSAAKPTDALQMLIRPGSYS
jgi:hypothetical protein